VVSDVAAAEAFIAEGRVTAVLGRVVEFITMFT